MGLVRAETFGRHALTSCLSTLVASSEQPMALQIFSCSQAASSGPTLQPPGKTKIAQVTQLGVRSSLTIASVTIASEGLTTKASAGNRVDQPPVIKLGASMTSLKAPFLAHESLLSDLSATGTQASSVASAAQSTIASANTLQLTFPAGYHVRNHTFQELDPTDSASLETYLEQEVNVKRLNEIHRYLWLAGLPRPARPLFHQILLGRTITVTGDADLHLVWHRTRVFIKPLPDFIMCQSIWTTYLCKDPALYESAAGLLLSYMWLVCTKIDLKIAQNEGLLPTKISWEQWTIFSRAVLQVLDYHSFQDINPRYQYGELRLRRINWIYRLGSQGHKLTNLIRGYSFLYHEYSTFFERNTAWLVGLIGYIAVVLTAMQVGLGTNKLKDNDAFQNASYGFTIFSILAPLIVLFMVAAFTIVLIIFNALYTLRARRRQRTSTPTGPSNTPTSTK